MTIFPEIEKKKKKNYPLIYMAFQIEKEILRKVNKAGSIIPPDFKQYYKDKVIKTGGF